MKNSIYLFDKISKLTFSFSLNDKNITINMITTSILIKILVCSVSAPIELKLYNPRQSWSLAIISYHNTHRLNTAGT